MWGMKVGIVKKVGNDFMNYRRLKKLQGIYMMIFWHWKLLMNLNWQPTRGLIASLCDFMAKSEEINWYSYTLSWVSLAIISRWPKLQHLFTKTKSDPSLKANCWVIFIYIVLEGWRWKTFEDVYTLKQGLDGWKTPDQEIRTSWG